MRWFSFYLSIRKQMFSIEGIISPVPVTSRVIQGIVLRPLLVFMYISDLFHGLLCGIPFMFADDQNCLWSHFRRCKQKRNLNNLRNWCSVWGIEFAASKGCFMKFPCQISSGSLVINDLPMWFNPSERDFGLLYFWIHFSKLLNVGNHRSFKSFSFDSWIGNLHFPSQTLPKVLSQYFFYSSCRRQDHLGQKATHAHQAYSRPLQCNDIRKNALSPGCAAWESTHAIATNWSIVIQ